MGRSFLMSEQLAGYVKDNWVRESDALAELAKETAQLEEAGMQISPDQGQFMALLVRSIGAKRCLEIGVFTGYSSLAIALALPEDGRIVALDVSEEFTFVARRHWHKAGVAHKIDLRLAPALETLAVLKSEGQSFDFAFIDADKVNYRGYYEACLGLVRPNGLIAIDNVLWGGKVAEAVDDPDTNAIRDLNAFLHGDDRVDLCLAPLGDGVTLARVR